MPRRAIERSPRFTSARWPSTQPQPEPPGERVRVAVQPVQIGPAELACRIVSTSHQTTLVEGHLPTEDFIAYQEARARGGTGLIVLEAVAVAPSGLLTAHTLGGYLDEIVDGYRWVAAAVQGHGTKLFTQLFHGGCELIASAPRPPAVSASALPSARFHTEPRAINQRGRGAYRRVRALRGAGGAGRT